MDLADMISEVTQLIGRKMRADEFVMLGRLRDAGKTSEEVAEVLGKIPPPDLAESKVPVRRAEVVNRKVRVFD